MLRRTARSAAAALAGMAVFVAACGPGASGSIPQADCGRPFSPRIQHGLRDVALVVRRTYHIPGIAVAVTVPGEGCWVGASGLADIARRLPLTAQDAFPIGSITNTFTATVILQLVQQRKLSLVNGTNRRFEAGEDEAVSDAAAASIAQIVVPGGLR